MSESKYKTLDNRHYVLRAIGFVARQDGWDQERGFGM